MKTHRQQRVADLIRSEVATILSRGLKEHFLAPITVTDVEVTADLKLAKVYYTVLGGAYDKKKVVEALENAKSYIRGILRKNLVMRFIPHLEFHYDTSYEQGARIDELLNKVKQ